VSVDGSYVAVPVDGSSHVPLTESTTESVFAGSYFPDDERFIYVSDEGGDELDHVFVRELDGSVRDLTPGEKLKASFDGFSHDGKTFYVSTNERDPKFFDLYEYDLRPQELIPRVRGALCAYPENR